MFESAMMTVNPLFDSESVVDPSTVRPALKPEGTSDQGHRED